MSGFETVEQDMIKRNAVSSKDNPIASNGRSEIQCWQYEVVKIRYQKRYILNLVEDGKED